MLKKYNQRLTTIAAILLAAMLLTGCANTYKVQYNTEPMGASIICGGSNEGYSPVTLEYSLNEENKEKGFFKTVPCTAVWSSGVKKNFGNTWDIVKFPGGVMSTLTRPNSPGYSQDADFAFKIQQMRRQQAQAQAEANTRALNDLNRAIRDATPKTTNTNCYGTYGGVNCTSTSY